MKNKEALKPFSIKKLLLCILCSTIVTTFIGFTLLFISQISTWVMSEIMTAADGNSEFLIEAGENIEKNLEEINAKQKAVYGEQYPAIGILVQSILYYFRSVSIVHTYALTLLSGIVLGVIIYIVSIQGAKGKQLLIELVGAFVILFLIISAINLGYKAIINKAINEVGVTDSAYETYVYDIESNNIIIPYIGVFVIVYVVNLMRQKILTNKLNKELNNK